MNQIVRIKPYNPRKGYVLKTYVFQGMLFSVDKGWYQPPQSVIDKLRYVHSKPDDLDSPLAFDICTPEEAEALMEEERRAELEKAEPDSPVRITRVTRSGSERVRRDDVMTTPDFDTDDSEDDDEESDAVAVVTPAPAPVASAAPGAPRRRKR
jgi:hypothetical protein